MVHSRFKKSFALRMTNLNFLLLPNLIDFVPDENIVNDLGKFCIKKQNLNFT